MMSTAILMAMGTEQSSKQPAARDAEQLEGPTFTQTLDAQMEVSSAVLERDSKSGMPAESENGKTESAGTNMADVANFAPGSKAKVFVGLQTRALGESSDIKAGKIKPWGAATVEGAQALAKPEDAKTEPVELAVSAEQENVQTEGFPQIASTANSQTEDVMPQELQADKNQIQISSFETPVFQKETAGTGKAQEAVPAKKTAKTLEVDAMPAVASAKSAATVHPVIDETKSMHGVVAEATIPIPGQATVAHVASVALATPVEAPNISFGAAGDKSGESTSAAFMVRSTSVGGTSATGGGSDSKNSVPGGKSSVSDRETALAASGDPGSSIKIDAKVERLQTVAVNAGSDGDVKTQALSEPSVAMVHALMPGSDLTAGAAASMVTASVKLSHGETGAHMAGLPSGLREQDDSAGVARSMDPMPRTLSATPTALEVGIPDGMHGWLKVRAEMTDGGVVNASVSAASPVSQEMLHRELPSLTAYLQSEKVAVNTVVVHPTASTGAESRATPGTESGGSGQTSRQSNEGGEQRQSSVNAAPEIGDEVMGYQVLHGVDGDGTMPLAAYGSGGSWLSVRA